MLGKDELALEDCNTAISLKPDKGHCCYARSLAYKRLGMHDHALEDLSKAISLEPDRASYFYARSLAYKRLGKHDLAVEDPQQGDRAGSRQRCLLLRPRRGVR